MLALLSSALLAWTAPPASNVLLLVADDIGVDRIAAYGEHPDPGRTPNLDHLAREGVLFRNVWAMPTCSPARATMLTGRYGFRTGMGHLIQPGDGGGTYGLPERELTLPEILRPTHACIALGKWHLADAPPGPIHPLQSGFAHHAGSFGNLTSFGAPNYYWWKKSVDGEGSFTSVYATTDTTDDALRAAHALPEPWFLWVAYNAAHKPLHAPPPELHDFELAGDPDDTPVEHMKAVTQALDTEIGRLLEGLGDLRARTSVLFVTDNGTQEDSITAPFPSDKGKGTVYEGGVGVPLIVSGPSVTAPGRECDALVNTTDLFATILELAGLELAEALPAGHVHDSVSLVPYLRDPATPPVRRFLFTESFRPNGPGPYNVHRQAVRNERYKYLRRFHDGTEEFYDLVADPFEAQDLLTGSLSADELAQLKELRAQLDALDPGPGAR